MEREELPWPGPLRVPGQRAVCGFCLRGVSRDTASVPPPSVPKSLLEPDAAALVCPTCSQLFHRVYASKVRPAFSHSASHQQVELAIDASPSIDANLKIKDELALSKLTAHFRLYRACVVCSRGKWHTKRQAREASARYRDAIRAYRSVRKVMLVLPFRDAHPLLCCCAQQITVSITQSGCIYFSWLRHSLVTLAG